MIEHTKYSCIKVGTYIIVIKILTFTEATQGLPLMM